MITWWVFESVRCMFERAERCALRKSTRRKESAFSASTTHPEVDLESSWRWQNKTKQTKKRDQKQAFKKPDETTWMQTCLLLRLAAILEKTNRKKKHKYKCVESRRPFCSFQIVYSWNEIKKFGWFLFYEYTTKPLYTTNNNNNNNNNPQPGFIFIMF